MQGEWIWICLTALWQRWWPDKVCLELLDDKVQDGYHLLERDEGGCARVWLSAWSDVRCLCDATGVRSIADFDDRFPMTQSLYNWSQDLEEVLWNAGLRDRDLLVARIGVCEEALRRFPHEDRLMTENRRQALAGTCFEVGEVDEAEEHFRTWLAADPRWGFGWIAWAVWYFSPAASDRPRDYAKAEQLLREGYSTPGVRDRDAIAGWLKSLCEETGRQPEARAFEQEAKKLRRQAERSGTGTPNRVSRRRSNDVWSSVSEQTLRPALNGETTRHGTRDPNPTGPATPVAADGRGAPPSAVPAGADGRHGGLAELGEQVVLGDAADEELAAANPTMVDEDPNAVIDELGEQRPVAGEGGSRVGDEEGDEGDGSDGEGLATRHGGPSHHRTDRDRGGEVDRGPLRERPPMGGPQRDEGDEVDERFDARYSARVRVYKYYIDSGRTYDPHRRRYAWTLPAWPDVRLLDRYAAALIGSHDFSTFAAAGDTSATRIRDVRSASFFMEGRSLVFKIAANAFLYRMVRSLVGTMIELERRKAAGEEMRERLGAQDREAAGQTAPAWGLFLHKVLYDERYQY